MNFTEVGRAIEADERVKKVRIVQNPDNPDGVIIYMTLHQREGWKDNLSLATFIDKVLLEYPEFLRDYLIEQAEAQVRSGLVGVEPTRLVYITD